MLRGFLWTFLICLPTQTIRAEELRPAEPSPPAANEIVPEGCVRLKNGDAAIVKYESREASPIGVKARYGLSRPKEDVFLVELNIRFRRGEGYEGSLSPKDLQQKYQKRIQECLDSFRAILKNERSSRTMLIRLTENTAVPVHEIEVVAPNQRTEIFRYPSDISCTAVLHQTLHLLGLPDEHTEKPKKREDILDCSISGPEDSVMNDRHEAMDLGVLPSSTFALEMCKCEKVGPACWELNQKNDGKGKACPSGTSSFLRNVDPDMKVSLNALNSPEMFVLNEENQLRAADSSPKVRSTMYPAHFRAITEPGCRDVNENYYACVPQFQRDTAAKAEAGAALGGSCQSMPVACRYGSYRWLE